MEIIVNKYPTCYTYSISNSKFDARGYLIVIAEVCTEDYYCYLVDNMIEMSSASFRSRIESDSLFKIRMTARASALLKRAK